MYMTQDTSLTRHKYKKFKCLIKIIDMKKHSIKKIQTLGSIQSLDTFTIRQDSC